MSESKLQAQILRALEAHGLYVFKTITTNRSGVPDIIGLTKSGQFFGIEVKFGSNKLSALQEWHLQQIKASGGIAIEARSIADVSQLVAIPMYDPMLLANIDSTVVSAAETLAKWMDEYRASSMKFGPLDISLRRD